MTDKNQALGAPVDLVLGPLPPADPHRALQYGAIRYVAGYPESYMHEYAQAYAAAQVAAERERCAKVCDSVAGNSKDHSDQFRRGAGRCAADIRA